MENISVRPDETGYTAFSYALLVKDIIFGSTILFLTMSLRSQIPLMAGSVLTYFYLKFTGRPCLVKNLAVAFIVSLIWVSIAKENYHYGDGFLEIHGFCPYPVFVWGMGLFAVSLLISHTEHLTGTSLPRRLAFYTVLCTALIIVVEYSAFHIFRFQNQATLKYAPVPVINCIHGPRWMQVMYFLLGPVYCVTVYSVENLKGGREIPAVNNTLSREYHSPE